jgi:hypothetical protein
MSPFASGLLRAVARQPSSSSSQQLLGLRAFAAGVTAPPLPEPVQLPFEFAQPAKASSAEGEAFVIAHGLLYVALAKVWRASSGRGLTVACAVRRVRSGSKQKYVVQALVCLVRLLSRLDKMGLSGHGCPPQSE